MNFVHILKDLMFSYWFSKDFFWDFVRTKFHMTASYIAVVLTINRKFNRVVAWL